MIFLVFAQRNEVALDEAAVTHNGARFFGTRVARVPPEGGASLEDDAHGPESANGSARLRLSIENGDLAVRRIDVRGRRRTPDDVYCAERAEAHATDGTASGMSALAERCETIWEIDAHSEHDKGALLLAGILATVTLGPILVPIEGSDAHEIFGVRTARTKLEAVGSPYR